MPFKTETYVLYYEFSIP